MSSLSRFAPCATAIVSLLFITTSCSSDVGENGGDGWGDGTIDVGPDTAEVDTVTDIPDGTDDVEHDPAPDTSDMPSDTAGEDPVEEEPEDLCADPCDDGLECTDDSCDPATGCVFTPMDERCVDTIDCTVDACAPGMGCVSTPNHDLCEDGEICDLDCDGCVIDVTPPGKFLAHSSSTLYLVDPALFTSANLGSIGSSVTDLAVTQGRQIYAITFSSLYSIDACTRESTLVGSLGPTSMNALVAAPDGMLFGADNNGDVWRIDPETAASTRIGNYGAGLSSSGDIAWGPDGQLYGAANDAASYEDVLVTVDPVSGVASVVGNMGFVDVYGLAVLDEILYGVTDGQLLIILDMGTGAGTEVGSIGASYWGAASPPPMGS